MDPRRHRLRAEAPELQLRAEQEGPASGPEVRPLRQGRRGQPGGDRLHQTGRHQDRRFPQVPQRCQGRRESPGGDPRCGRNRRQERPEPSRRADHPCGAAECL